MDINHSNGGHDMDKDLIDTPDAVHADDPDYNEGVSTDDAGYTVVNGRRIVRPCRSCKLADANYLVGSKGNSRNKRRAPLHSYSGHYCLACCHQQIDALNAADANRAATKMVETDNVTLEYATAVTMNLDAWVPACGGHEQPAQIGQTRVLYCWNAATGEHGYINLDTDMLCDEHDLRSLGLAS